MPFTFQTVFSQTCFSTNMFYIQLVRTEGAGRFFPREHLPPVACSTLGYQPPNAGIPLLRGKAFVRDCSEPPAAMQCLKEEP